MTSPFLFRPKQPKMINLLCFQRTCMKQFSSHSAIKLGCLINSFNHLPDLLLLRIDPFWIEFSYFIFLSVVGFGALKASTAKDASLHPRNIDMFFTSVSATTVSSMSTVEMEVFSNIQLILMTILMFTGGEVFTSMLGLQLRKFKKTKMEGDNKVRTVGRNSDFSNPKEFLDEIELGVVSHPQLENGEKPNPASKYQAKFSLGPDSRDLSWSSIELLSLLSYIVLCYLLVVHVVGASLVYIYTSFIPSARKVIKKKGLNLLTFAVFTTVSTFANCGFVPTNENMIVFKKNSGLLLILIAQILLGNTFFPSCLRFVIWISEKLTNRAELTYILKNSGEIGYDHLFSSLESKFLAVTVLGLILVQFITFCSLEWRSETMAGLNAYQKLVGSSFEVVNSRHAGESIVDLSLLTPAILVLFVVMMYLPPCTSFLPTQDSECTSETEKKTSKKQGKNILENLLFSPLAYLTIFIILICITEKEKMKEDPLNFNLLTIVVEVISAYGNVGFSMGYSCKRQIKPDANCIDASYGLVGKWSDGGKFILILVMFFGRLKKFSMKGGKSWRIS